MNLSAPFIARAVATTLIMWAILLAGIIAYQLLPVSSLPEVDYPTIQVVTFYPGASPDVMASSVTAPLERQFGQMPGLNEMTSSSSLGASVIVLQFDLHMALDVAEQQVQAAINAASGFLPDELPTPPVYNKVNPADTPILTLALTSNTLSLPQIEDYAENRLAQRISELSGVGLVSISGGQRPAVRVQANPNALSAYGLSLESVRNAIVNANVNAAKGSFDGPRLAYTINSNDQLLTAAEYKPLIIAYNNDSPVRLSDVANVIDGAENTLLAGWMNEKPAIIVNIQRQPGANVIAVVDSIKKLLPQLRANLPGDIQLTVLTDRTITIRASVRDVQFELLLAVVLVVLVIFVFLCNVYATLIPSIAVPLSLVGAFAVMYLLGFSLNNLSLMALTIATGFVVDDAIVMIENIARHVEEGESPAQAAHKGSRQIGFTILSLTVSLIAVLIPLLFMGDLIGRLFREFALTLTITIVISAFVSLTFTPMLCARLLRKRSDTEMGKFEIKSRQIQTKIVQRYDQSLQWVFGHQGTVIFIFLITLGITAVAGYFIPKGFFPIQDTGVIQGITQADESVSFSAMSQYQQQLAKVVLADPAVANLSSFIGVDGTNITLNSGRMLITLKPIAERDVSASQVIRRLTPKLQQIHGVSLYMQPVQDLSIESRVSRTQYQYSIGSPNANDVAIWSDKLITKLSKSNILLDVATDQQNEGLETSIQIDRDTASRLGISMQSIDNILYDAFGQRIISTMFTQRNQYRVILEALPDLQQNTQSLENIYLNSSVGNTSATLQTGPVPLHTFASISQNATPLVLTREGQFPSATISFNLAPNAALGQAIKEIDQVTADLKIPPSVQTSFEGSARIFQQSLQNEGWLILAAIFVVYIVLGVLYESFIHPLTILSTLPSATMGALLALYLTNNDLSVIALIGIILLIGIVMKNAILMIDFALEQERKHKKAPLDAIHQAALLRFRPILMTTLASMFSAFPLAFGTGMGTELRHPLGIAIIGGLIVSQLLTLYTTPVIYLAFDKIARRFGISSELNDPLIQGG